ncbi:Peptidoglycan/LPS O-acetylase OafA/YrhL, contains acyltransferase and SGNH-hydrolase domains [Salipiger thiooxidans]|uniref:Peptidoglycan/LPS O-acetylase OafA/YrhL, contains acyltransferase and SGNH-hydrolase domains n=1 Tax=Salipiger thiooxidans TaxID=282683 RepID=A0A1G7LLU1_9RHOB|nr:acyltransferase family protein [Salipiger thiooxidans]SDF50383.1 Peptidoglycan/LPS O-acetylase OafA/YrhL, contains acyltransferase and SGNH-hydrolase domains [Salipiger thiooxidans]
MPAIRYQPHVDGLRTLAVLPVIAFHLDKALLPGGFLGVDVFFVISGYLITSILLREMEAGSFSFMEFWARRIRRILPVVGTMVIVTLLAFALLGFPVTLVEHAQAGLSALLMVANIYIPMHFGSYWGTSAEDVPFLHMWSLAVEEQFYLFFPGLLFLILRFRPRWVTPAIVLAMIASFAAFLWLLQSRPTVAFYMFPTRAWELGAGCLLASMRLTLRSRALSEVMTGLGIALIVFSYVSMPAGSQVSVPQAVCAVVGAAFIIRGGQNSRIAKALLSNRPMVGIGKLSYSLYIWHWPVIVLADEIGLASDRPAPHWLLLVIIFVLSLASYYLVEGPVRRARAPLALPLAFPSAGVLACLLVVGLWSMVPANPTGYERIAYAGPYYDLSPVQPMDDRQTQLKRVGQDIRTRPEDRAPLYKDGGLLLDYGSGPKIMIMGDSHSLMWAPVLDRLSEENGFSLFVSGMSGDLPFADFTNPSLLRGNERATGQQRREIAAARRERVETWHPDLVIISTRNLPSDEVLQDFAAYFENRGIPLLFTSQPPVMLYGNNGAHHFLSYVSRFRDITPASLVEVRVSDEHLVKSAQRRAILEACKTCHFFNVSEFLEGHTGHSLLAEHGIINYYDDDHLSIDGGNAIAPALLQAIQNILQGLPDPV